MSSSSPSMTKRGRLDVDAIVLWKFSVDTMNDFLNMLLISGKYLTYLLMRLPLFEK